MSDKIFVTKPSLAPLEEYLPYLERIWDSGIMTHNGPLLRQLEQEVSAREDGLHTVCVANGTCAMQLAIRALDLQGEIITTPFTFIATASIIAWERCTPVFVDIDPGTWNLDPAKVEAAITENTVAILPVHVFSAPCDVDRIEAIAEQHGLKVIYDAAHAMSVRKGGRSIMLRGDVSCTSFHATKILNTCEGGACFTRDSEVAERIRRMRFFGFDDAKEIVDGGMNAKMTEMSAALGLANLRHLDEVLCTRRRLYELYMELLGRLSYVSFQAFDPDEYNYSYMPVLFDSEQRAKRGLATLHAEDIYPRRYFHPSLNTLPVFRQSGCPISESVASRILCLPLYTSLSTETIRRICSILGRS